MGKNIKRKHHYITRYYLEGFTDKNGRVWTYLKSDPMNPYSNTPKETATKKDFYRLYDLEAGIDINTVENFLEEKVESPATEAFKKLIIKEFPSGEERFKVALFLGVLMIRTPGYLNHLSSQCSNELNARTKLLASNKDKFRELYRKATIEASEAEIEKDRQDILAGKILTTLHRNHLLDAMLRLGAITAELLNRMKWALIETDNDCQFITSDNLMNVRNPKLPHGFHKTGLSILDTVVAFPLSNKICLMIVNNPNFQDGIIFSVSNKHSTKEGVRINIKNFVKNLNKEIFVNSNQYVFVSSNHDKLKKCFKKLSDGLKK